MTGIDSSCRYILKLLHLITKLILRLKQITTNYNSKTKTSHNNYILHISGIIYAYYNNILNITHLRETIIVAV